MVIDILFGILIIFPLNKRFKFATWLGDWREEVKTKMIFHVNKETGALGS
jgi:hypothetical protein